MCSVCESFEVRQGAAGNLEPPFGAVAQLVEHVHGMDGVARSSRVSSTDPLEPFHRVWRCIGFTLGGFVAGEGCYSIRVQQPPFADGTPRRRFVFSVQVATRDRQLLEALRTFLGFGPICDKAARRPDHQPMSEFAIASRKGHNATTIPFSEIFLLPSAKRAQFERWRDALRAYEIQRPTQYGKGPSTCSVPGCEKPVRGRMLCRAHYYRVTGY